MLVLGRLQLVQTKEKLFGRSASVWETTADHASVHAVHRLLERKQVIRSSHSRFGSGVSPALNAGSFEAKTRLVLGVLPILGLSRLIVGGFRPLFILFLFLFFIC